MPEDFYVKEILDLKLGNGDYSYFLLRKRDIGTLEAINTISKELGISQKRIGFAGNKDKKAVTEQHVSIYKFNKENNLKINGIELVYLGNGKERINLGDLKYNSFRIVVRDLDKKIKLVSKRFKNYFDDQRFGIDKSNHMIGRYIVKREFDKTCGLFGLNVERNNFIGALRKISIRKLRFYINSYQSYIFNRILHEYKGKQIKIPILGYLTEFKNKDIKKIYNKIMKEEDIKEEAFIIKQMPELSSEGTERNAYEEAIDFKYSYDNDEIFNNKYKAILEFNLNPGAYATCFVKNLFAD